MEQSSLKGQCHEIFDLHFFASNSSFGPSGWWFRRISISFAISGRYLKLKIRKMCSALWDTTRKNIFSLTDPLILFYFFTVWLKARLTITNFFSKFTHLGPGKVLKAKQIIPRCINFSALYPTAWKNAPRCGIQRGKLFRVVSHNVEKCSALWDTTRKIVPRCIPQRGIKEIISKIGLFCIQKFEKITKLSKQLFRVVGYNAEKYSALYPTTWKNVPRCGIQRGKMLRVVSHNAENCSALYPTTRKNLFL